MKRILAFMVLLLPTITWAADTQITLSSKVDQVVLFLNGAQVSRSATTQLTPGKTLLIFKNISPYVRKESLQVKGEGAFTVLSVVHQLDYLQLQTKRAEITNLETEKETVSDQLATAQNLLQIYRNEENMLIKNQEIKGQNTGLKITDLKEAVAYQRARLIEVKQNQLESTKKIQRLNNILNQYQNQLQNIQAQSDLATSEIVVTVNAPAATAAKFKVSYLVEQAAWYPTYDIRVIDISKPLILSSKANVSQQSGENWNDVKLTLSTGDPALTGVKPELQTWRLNYYRPGSFTKSTGAIRSNIPIVSGLVTDETGQPLPGVTILVKGTATGTTSDAMGRYTLQLPAEGNILTFSFIGFQTQETTARSSQLNITLKPDTKQLEEVAVVGYGLEGKTAGLATQSSPRPSKVDAPAPPVDVSTIQNQTSVSFEITMPYSIPTDGKNYSVDIKEQVIPALYEYYCAPKLDTDAFLTAKIINWENYELLEGEASLFFEGTFLGKTILNTNIVSDTLAISLGRDKNISLIRTKLKEENKRQLLGNNRTETISWDISARNKKMVPVSLILEDQLPISSLQEIEVTRLTSPEAEYHKETGKLTWRLDLQPSQEKKIGFKYSVKYPKGQAVILE